MGADAGPYGGAVYVGIATTSHNAGVLRGRARRIDDTPLRPAENVPPQGRNHRPCRGTTFTAGAVVPIAAAASGR